MVKRRREVLGAAAIALVQAHGVPPGQESALREALHVSGLARTLQAVDQDERGAFPGLPLPVAFAENSRAGLDFEFARHARGQARESPPPVRGRHRLRVRIAQQRMRLEGLHSIFILRQLQGRPLSMGALDFTVRGA